MATPPWERSGSSLDAVWDALGSASSRQLVVLPSARHRHDIRERFAPPPEARAALHAIRTDARLGSALAAAGAAAPAATNAKYDVQNAKANAAALAWALAHGCAEAWAQVYGVGTGAAASTALPQSGGNRPAGGDGGAVPAPLPVPVPVPVQPQPPQPQPLTMTTTGTAALTAIHPWGGDLPSLRQALVRLRATADMDGRSVLLVASGSASCANNNTAGVAYDLVLTLPSSGEIEELHCKPQALRIARASPPEGDALVFRVFPQQQQERALNGRWLATACVRFRVAEKSSLRGYVPTARLLLART